MFLPECGATWVEEETSGFRGAKNAVIGVCGRVASGAVCMRAWSRRYGPKQVTGGQ